MGKGSIIERVAAERKKKKMRRMRAKKVRRVDSAKLPSQDKTDLKEQLKQAASKLGPKDQPQLEDLMKLVQTGNKKQWEIFIAYNLKNKIKMEFPPLEQDKCKFSEYGYRQLIELIIESQDFLRIITEVQDISGFNIVGLNYLIRGDDPTLRGIEALCSLLVNKENRYNPVSETDFKYLNIILDSFTMPDKDGNNRIWNIKTENKEIKITAAFDKGTREWIYTIG